MADVTLTIGDRAHIVGCRDGEEAQVRHLGTLIEERWDAALRASGNMGNERAMLFVALMLADALTEARRQPPAATGVDSAQLDRIADKLEALATALEDAAPNA
ncbi:cell division protein ZapA [Hephaestia sp. GCM10023244]|uniref:cell division protein ZapA n=1 Tax=unclassified Hephaestia TaxID=2631281 RepID=UPI002076FA97|nr:cell division protein ZapA [Hephaestia sp. MAHUQ-44]MCM8730198.1 cell division protein ZapA [Hephaestia sp. MAHUQ-44]